MSYYTTKIPNPSYSYANVTIANSGSAASLSGPILTATAGDTAWVTTASVAGLGDYNGSGKLVLKGKNADVEINGKSLSQAIQAIEEALLIPGQLNRNTKLEQEFEELKQAAEQYRELETKFLEQKRVWDILKKQDQ